MAFQFAQKKILKEHPEVSSLHEYLQHELQENDFHEKSELRENLNRYMSEYIIQNYGKEIAKKFAKENYNLVINYVSEKTNTEELKKEFEALGAEVLFIKTNVTSYEECEKMAKDAINKFGKIDVLVNNAGVTKDSLLLRMKEEDFDTVINVNLKGNFNVTKACIPYMMKKKSGKIVNISSVVGISGNSGQANYAASKAGIIGFTKSVAKELASRNILANCVAPGYIATDMTNGLSDAVKESINNQIPLKRVGMPEEVAKAVYFLAGEENSYITGQVLNVDGGMLI